MVEPRFFSVETAYVALAGSAIDLLTAAVVSFHVGWALVLMARGRGTDVARGVVADGVIAGLGFGLAGSLLKTIALQDWPHIRMFAFVFLLRTLLKRVFQRERQIVDRRTAWQGQARRESGIAQPSR